MKRPRPCMYRDGPRRPGIENAGDRSSAGSRPRSECCANTTLPEGDFNIPTILNMDELDVGSIRKSRMVFEQRADSLRERIVNLVKEERAMRITRRARGD